MKVINKILMIIIVSITATAIASLGLIGPLTEYYTLSEKQEIMRNLCKTEVLTEIKANITSYFASSNKNSYSLDDLFKWEANYLTFVDKIENRPSDPRAIIKQGIGKCREYSIVFTTACISIGTDSRILCVFKTDFSESPHAFNEVKINGSWVPVDASANTPCRLVFNDTSVYDSWDWWPKVGTTYKIFAFDQNGGFEDVTDRYVTLYL